MIHCRDAKVQKAHERCHHQYLMQEGSKNEDEGNSDGGRGIEDDEDDEDDGGGTQVGHRNTLGAPL